MAPTYVKKVFNELHGIAPDYQLTIPIGIDSKSAIDTTNSHKETTVDTSNAASNRGELWSNHFVQS
jgi:hypothetical protein